VSATATREAAASGWTSAERSASVVVDRGAEAAAVAEFILESPTRVAVLYGKPRSGKSQLITHEVIPRLRASVGGRFAIGYGDCLDGGLPTMLAAGGRREPLEAMIRSNSIVVLDSFDWFLDQPRDAQRRALEPLFTLLAAPGCVSILVLVTDVRHLTNVHALSEFVPRIGEAVRELGSITVADGLQRFSRSEPASAVEYSAGALELLTRQCEDLERAGYEVSFELLQLIDRWFRGQEQGPAGRRVVTDVHVLAVNGVSGILTEYLDAEIARLGIASADEHEVADAILEAAQIQRSVRLDQVDVEDIGRQVGVDHSVVSKVLGALAGHRGLLHDVPGCGLRFVPPQVASVVQERLVEQRGALDRAHRVVAEGLRSWMELGTLLPSQRFVEVHRERRRLRLTAEQSRFVFLCALRREDDEVAGASTYWLHRLHDRDDASDILLASVLDDDPAVAVRSAELLREFPSADARERLTFLALVHEEHAVRAAALSSLGAIRDHSVKRRLREEAADAKRPHRLRAIEALGIFRDDETTDLLKELVHDPKTPLPVRDAAITALSSIGTAQSVDALVDIALLDQDAMDRAAAAKALATTKPRDLNRRILDRLGPPEPTPWVKMAIIGILLLGTVLIAVIALMVSILVAVPAVLLLSVAFAWPTSMLLVAIRERRISRRSFRGVLAWVLFIAWAGTVGLVVHGSTHMLIRQWRRGLRLLVLELIGIGLLWVSPIFADELSGIIRGFYFGGGLVLIWGTYLVDVVAVLCETLLFADATMRRRRKAAAYSVIVGNPAVTALLLDALKSDQAGESTWARKLWKRVAEFANPQLLVDRLASHDPALDGFVIEALKRTKTERTVRDLEGIWAPGDERLRSTIAAVLYRAPSQSSLGALDRLPRPPSARMRLRYGLAKLAFRLGVWPRHVWLIALTAVPAVSAFLYHGVRALENPAWSSLVVLRRALHNQLPTIWGLRTSGTDSTIFLTADYLARAHPHRSADEFLEHLRDSVVAHKPQLGGAVASALVVTVAGMNNAEIRERILRSATDIVEVLLRSDTLTIDHAVRSLVQGANGHDFQRSGASLFLLKSLIFHRDADGARAISALGLVNFDRVIPLLDTLLDKRSQSPIASRLREQLDHVSAQAEYDAANDPSPARAMGRLRDILDSIKTKPANFAMVRAQAEELMRDEESGRSAVTLRRIAADPQAEGGYQELLQHLTADGGYHRAVEVFDSLKREYSGSLWPAKILASIYHESLPEEAGAFEKSYQEMKSLEQLTAYAELRERNMEWYRRIRADFSEITLSARRYEETEQLAEEILEDTGSPQYHRLNAALFVLIGRVMQGDSARADSAIGSLEGIVKQLPNDFYNNWVYPGTLVFIRRSDLPEATKDALLALCLDGYWPPNRKAEVLARTGALLGTLRSGRFGSVR